MNILKKISKKIGFGSRKEVAEDYYTVSERASAFTNTINDNEFILKDHYIKCFFEGRSSSRLLASRNGSIILRSLLDSRVESRLIRIDSGRVIDYLTGNEIYIIERSDDSPYVKLSTFHVVHKDDWDEVLGKSSEVSST